MQIIFPSCSYGEALETAGCETLDSRRTKICINTSRKIIKQGRSRNYVRYKLEKTFTTTTPEIHKIYHCTSVEQNVLRTAFSQARSPRSMSKFIQCNICLLVFL